MTQGIEILDKIFNPTKPNPIDFLRINQDGSIFNLGQKDYVNYLSCYLLSTFFFFLVFYLIKLVYQLYYVDEMYNNKTYKERAFFLSVWVANVHHIVAFSLAVYNFYYPDCGGTGKPFEWFLDEACFLTVDKRFVFACLFCCGYLTFDYIVQAYIAEVKGDLAAQTLFHHIIGGSGLVIGLSCGFGAPGIGNLTLICEISSIFLNYRTLLFSRDDVEGFIPLANRFLFFLTYTIFRMCLFPYGTYKMFINIIYAWDLMSPIARIMYIFMLCEYILMFCLNIFWYRLVLRGVLIQLGLISSRPKDKLKDSIIVKDDSKNA